MTDKVEKDFFTIKKWNAVALWTFGDGQAVKCAICRSLLADICVPCQTEDNVDPNGNNNPSKRNFHINSYIFFFSLPNFFLNFN